MKSRAKFWSLAASLAILLAVLGFAFAQPVLAADDSGQYLSGDAIPPTSADNCSTYAVGGVSSGNIHVTLVVQAGDALNEGGEAEPDTRFRVVASADLSGNGPHTVTSLLKAVNDDGSVDLIFKGRDSQSNLIPFTSTTDYLAAVEHGDTEWVAGEITMFYAFNGWEFRVNDKFPVESFTGESGSGWRGTGILDTPVYDGDVVSLFYEFPSKLFAAKGGSGDISARYVRAVQEGSFTNNTLTVQLQVFNDYINPNNYLMSVYNYTDLANPVPSMTASIYQADGVNLVQENQPVNADGTVVFTSGSLAAGNTYVVTTTPAAYFTTTVPAWVDVNNAFITRTEGYSKITIQTNP